MYFDSDRRQKRACCRDEGRLVFLFLLPIAAALKSDIVTTTLQHKHHRFRLDRRCGENATRRVINLVMNAPKTRENAVENLDQRYISLFGNPRQTFFKSTLEFRLN